MYRLSKYRRPTKNDWRNLFEEIEYEFKKSLHYRIVLIVALLLSLGSVIEILSIIIIKPETWVSWLMLIIGFVIAIIGFLLFVQGLLRLKDIAELPGKPLMRAVGPILFEVGLLSVALFIKLEILVNGLMPIIGFVIAIIGVWLFVEGLIGLRSYLYILTFLLFCWFPIVFIFTSFALWHHLSWGWELIRLFWVVVLGGCSFLWLLGLILEEKASNPLRGILDGVVRYR